VRFLVYLFFLILSFPFFCSPPPVPKNAWVEVRLGCLLGCSAQCFMVCL